MSTPRHYPLCSLTIIINSINNDNYNNMLIYANMIITKTIKTQMQLYFISCKGFIRRCYFFKRMLLKHRKRADYIRPVTPH